MNEANILATKLRTAADAFLSLSFRVPQMPDAMHQQSLKEDCGKIVVRAHHLRLLESIPGLDDLVRWFEGDVVEWVDSPEAALPKTRCHANVFWMLAGNHLVQARLNDGVLEIASTTSGGILPEQHPEAWSGFPASAWPDMNRHYASVCKVLADMIANTSPPKMPRDWESWLPRLTGREKAIVDCLAIAPGMTIEWEAFRDLLKSSGRNGTCDDDYITRIVREFNQHHPAKPFTLYAIRPRSVTLRPKS